MKLSPLGISAVSECPSTPENCYKNGKPGSNAEAEVAAIEKSIKEKVESINFDAAFEITADYSDYGVKKEVTAPEGAFDLIELLDSNGEQRALN